MFAVGSTKAGFCPPSSRRIGVRFFAAASMTILPTLTLPVKKMKSNGSLRSSVTSSLLPVTAVTARGSKYFGTRSSKSLLVGGQPLGEFEYAWISCRKNLDRRVEEQSQWSIERSDYQSDAIGLPIDFGSVSAFPKSLGNDYVYGLHPLSQLSFRESCGPHGSHDLEDFFLASGLEITAHCGL